MRLRFFFNSQPDISDVGWANNLGPRSSNATKKVSLFDVLIEKVLSVKQSGERGVKNR